MVNSFQAVYYHIFVFVTKNFFKIIVTSKLFAQVFLMAKQKDILKSSQKSITNRNY